MAKWRHELVGPFPAGVDREQYDQLRRRVLWKMPSGIYLLGSRSGERRNFMTCNWVSQLALEPKTIGVSVERSTVLHELVEHRPLLRDLLLVPRTPSAPSCGASSSPPSTTRRRTR